MFVKNDCQAFVRIRSGLFMIVRKLKGSDSYTFSLTRRFL